MSALLGTVGARPTEPAELTRYLYEKHGQRVFTFCYSRLRNREEAQDAAQTTFIYVMRSLQRGVEPEFELAWLLKIAFNVCRGVRRSTGRDSAAIQEVEDIDALAAPPAAGYEGSEQLAALREALATLPESQRRGILLREWQGLSYAEIADELGLSLGAVETLLFRARRNLASRLEHVRIGVGAINAASLAPFFRSLARGGIGKLGLIGATASVALIPVVAAEVAPALADGKAEVALRSATPVKTVTKPQLGRHAQTLGVAAPAQTLLARAGANTAQPPAPRPQGATDTQVTESDSGEHSVTAPAAQSPSATLPEAPNPPKLDPIAAQTPQLPGAVPQTPQLPAAVPPVDTTSLEQLLTDPLAGVKAALP
jgi:RNA polymerase sigma-70 factor (ECF subfamily)